MQHRRLFLLAAAASIAACAAHAPRSQTSVECPSSPRTNDLYAELRRVAADSAFRAELRRVAADPNINAELRRMLADTSTTAELRRIVADTGWLAGLQPQIAEMEREAARLSACWRD